jgi:hypothetical protein
MNAKCTSDFLLDRLDPAAHHLAAPEVQELAAMQGFSYIQNCWKSWQIRPVRSQIVAQHVEVSPITAKTPGALLPIHRRWVSLNRCESFPHEASNDFGVR